MKKLFKILWQSAFAGALLLGGWGYTHISGFLGDPALVVFLILLLARNTGEVLVLKTNPFSTRITLSGVQHWIPVLSRLTMAFFCWFFPFADRRGILAFAGAEALRYTGLLLFSAGGAIQLVALHALSNQYSVHVTLQNDHKLVQHGLYRIIRHPMYLGLLLNMVGVPLVFRSWLVFPVLALVTVFVVSRIRQEDFLLREEFGSEFESYRQRTKLLVPYVC